jgi:hypothetical protein
MKFVLRFAGSFNILAGLSMLCFYHEGYKLLGIPRPDLVMELQLVGILVGLFGVGYHMVAASPLENRNILVLGFWSKFLGSVLGIVYVVKGKLPIEFLALLFFADIIYLPFFAVIIRRLRELAAARGST